MKELVEYVKKSELRLLTLTLHFKKFLEVRKGQKVA